MYQRTFFRAPVRGGGMYDVRSGRRCVPMHTPLGVGTYLRAFYGASVRTYVRSVGRRYVPACVLLGDGNY